ncbi:hypothetical protein HGRIS_008885 [Hohenbuehelia grisea]|uniref:Uncharacterized protein n=1 Tax=Hohenbuehelia grisea TaxID=104357 RepID=A0ABR3IZV8_9AGAR
MLGIRIPSTTVWMDPGLASDVCEESTKITREVTVDRVEYLSEIPSVWPVFRTKTAVVVDLRDSKFDFRDKHGDLLSADALIKNKDRDSSKGTTGCGDSTVKLSIFTGEFIECYRSHLSCSGCTFCEHIDPALVPTERYELDPTCFSQLVTSQIKSRVAEESSANHYTLIFFFILQNKQCDGVDANGVACAGAPVLKQNGAGGHFIGCSGWTPKSRQHRTLKIPSNVDTGLLSKLFLGQDLPTSMQKCTRIIPPHIGARLKQCPYPHQSNGQRSVMVHHNCPAKRNIYVPVDKSLRMACVVPDHTKPHSHPVLPPTKTSYEISQLYAECVKACGAVSATVKSVENALSTKLLMSGKTPSLFNPALHSTRKKQTMIRKEMAAQYPGGTGLAGVFELRKKSIDKPRSEQYIHMIQTTPSGGHLIFTFVPFLLNLIHKTVSFQVDTTFKRTIGDMKEWELVIWFTAVLQAVTIGRVYTDQADREQYKTIFEGLQQLVYDLTGRKMLFQRLSEGGNLLTMGVDMEAAQVLGAGDAFLPTNEPEYSKIHTDDPEEIVQYFVRACATHVSRGIRDLQSLVSPSDYQRLKNVPHIKSDDEFNSFNSWIHGLGIEKITNWWLHKKQHRWMIPSIVQSRSKISAEHWMITQASTNMNESQHKWTNGETGTGLSLAAAIVSAQIVDERVAHELIDKLNTGVLRNSRNDLLNRMGRSVTRSLKALEKARQVEDDREAQANKPSKPKRKKQACAAESSSSGRAPTTKSKGKAREVAHPYSNAPERAITPRLATASELTIPTRPQMGPLAAPMEGDVPAAPYGATSASSAPPWVQLKPMATFPIILPQASGSEVTIEMLNDIHGDPNPFLLPDWDMEQTFDSFLSSFEPYDGVFDPSFNS